MRSRDPDDASVDGERRYSEELVHDPTLPRPAASGEGRGSGRLGEPRMIWRQCSKSREFGHRPPAAPVLAAPSGSTVRAPHLCYAPTLRRRPNVDSRQAPIFRRRYRMGESDSGPVPWLRRVRPPGMGSRRADMEGIRLEEFVLDPKLATAIPRSLAESHQCIQIAVTSSGALVIGIVGAERHRHLAEIRVSVRDRCGLDVEFVEVLGDISEGWRRLYGEEGSVT